MTTIYHNPRCSKSREALQLLETHHEKVQVIHYLETPPSVEQLQEILELLGKRPIDLVRTKEPLWKERYQSKKLSGKKLLQVLSKNPQLIERPIVIKNHKAIIARPPEIVKEIL
ncbi:MAG: arsenate reductase (glutaredoxin) [Flavobacteriaceae bacterium]